MVSLGNKTPNLHLSTWCHSWWCFFLSRPEETCYHVNVCSRTSLSPNLKCGEKSANPQKTCCVNSDNEEATAPNKTRQWQICNAAINHSEMKHVNAICGKLKYCKQDSGAGSISQFFILIPHGTGFISGCTCRFLPLSLAGVSCWHQQEPSSDTFVFILILFIELGCLPLKEMVVSEEFKWFLSIIHSLRRLRKA